jgi:hypothetical protein
MGPSPIGKRKRPLRTMKAPPTPEAAALSVTHGKRRVGQAWAGRLAISLNSLINAAFDVAIARGASKRSADLSHCHKRAARHTAIYTAPQQHSTMTLQLSLAPHRR